MAASGRAGAEELLVMEKLKLGSVRSVACALTEQGEPACRITTDFSELESLMKLADDTGDAHSFQSTDEIRGCFRRNVEEKLEQKRW